MGSSFAKERRKHSRVGFATRIDVFVEVDGTQVCLEADSRDLSLRGVFARTQTQIPLGTVCRVSIYLTGSIEQITLEISGTIVRQTGEGIGIVFESMDVDTYTHLKNIVHYNSGDDGV